MPFVDTSRLHGVEVIEGEPEVTVDRESAVARAGVVAIVPGGVPHSVRALMDGRAIIVDYPLRSDFGQPAGEV